MTGFAKKQRILLVEKTPSLALAYTQSLHECGYDVANVGTGKDALSYCAAQPADLILIDLKLPDMDGLDMIDALRARHVWSPVIIMTNQGSLNIAVEAMKRGARDFLLKPFPIEKLGLAVRAELERPQEVTMPPELAGLNGSHPAPRIATKTRMQVVEKDPEFGNFVGTSPVMQDLYERIECAARSQATVFITGESGTGKEVCAESIHRYSTRASKPFVPINCAAIPRDLMESELFGHVKGAFTGAILDREGAARLADGGTLFLDEIAEMNPDMQTKLLRFLQNLTFTKVGGGKPEKTDVRIICATNRDPSDEIVAGRFREDLFYRLHVLPLHMPPLRKRGEDIVDIAYTLLRRYTAEERKNFASFTPDAEDLMRRYEWPGNIRQLQNVIRHAVVMYNGDVMTASLLAPSLTAAPEQPGRNGAPSSSTTAAPVPINGHAAAAALPPDQNIDILPLAQVERDAIERAIRLCAGNIPRAAAHLGVSPSTIYRKKAEWGENRT